MVAVLLSLALTADTPDPSFAIGKLGSPAFAEREAAAKILKQMGEPALAALEAAAKSSPDLETRARAGRLAEEIRLRTASAKAIAPKMVTLDHADVPLATVVNDLTQKTGIVLQLDPNGVRDPLRKVTVKTGPVPMWEAVERLCEAAGLREQFRAEIPVTNSRNRRGSYYGEEPMEIVNPATVPVILADGKPSRLPGSRDTAVRVLALPGNFPGSRVIRGSGEAILNLDITPAPGVNWTDVQLVNVLKAEDETGRPIAASRLAELPSFGNGYSMVWMGGGWAINGYYGGGQPRTAQPNPRVVPITLRTDDRASTKLATFEGVVHAEGSVPNSELFRTSKLDQLVASTVDAGTNRITLLKYETAKDGTTVLRMKLENIPVGSRRRQNVFNPFAAQIMFAESGGRGGNLLAPFQFTTAEGKDCGTPKLGSVNMVESNFGYAQEFDITFAKDRTPTGLVVKGTKSIALEIPFKMANVPLP
jgi:hypothetical protein